MTATYTRKRPVAGIMFGQKGYCGNRHFSSIELAKAAFDKYCDELRKVYGTPGRFHWTGRYIEESMAVGNNVLTRIRFVPLKKNGKPGTRIHIVSLYKIEDRSADSYMADPFYAVES